MRRACRALENHDQSRTLCRVGGLCLVCSQAFGSSMVSSPPKSSREVCANDLSDRANVVPSGMLDAASAREREYQQV